MRRPKRGLWWLRELGQVKAELRGTRFPKTPEEGIRQCAMLSAVSLQILKGNIRDHRERQRLLARISHAEAQRAPKWRKDCARFFGQ